jgi:hypothetical protein
MYPSLPREPGTLSTSASTPSGSNRATTRRKRELGQRYDERAFRITPRLSLTDEIPPPPPREGR